MALAIAGALVRMHAGTDSIIISSLETRLSA